MTISLVDRVKCFLHKWVTCILTLGLMEADVLFICRTCGEGFHYYEDSEELRNHECWIVDADREIN